MRVKALNFKLGEDSRTYVLTHLLLGLMSHPNLVSNVALVVHLHHEKTLFMKC